MTVARATTNYIAQTSIGMVELPLVGAVPLVGSVPLVGAVPLLPLGDPWLPKIYFIHIA